MRDNIISFLIVLAIIMILWIVCLLPFIVIDWTTGQHGRLTITSVDKNLFGTYTIYARNSDSAYTKEEEEITYCIDADNTELADFAKENIGKAGVTLVYPERRIGLYLWNMCGQSPIKQIIIP